MPRLFIPILFVASLFGVVGVPAYAQALPPTSADDQTGLQPYQSYHGGEIDSISLTNGTNQFFLRKFRFISTIPFEVAQAWLERVGVVGARAIARHLEPPHVTTEGQAVVPDLTEYVLTHFEDDPRTFSEFVAGIHSFQGYRGSYSAARQKEADEAKAFLNHPSKRVREWARLEMLQGEEDARVHGMREEERDM